jgi:uncharacterized iron-regulated protein
MKKNVLFLGLILMSQLFTNCSDNASDPVEPTTDLYKEVLTNVSVDVITKTYFDLYTNATLLKTACQNLSIGDETELQVVKNAWTATRAPWEKSEGFLYGPVDTEGIDPAIDAWPVDVTAIDAIIASGNPITSATLDNDDARGFHTIEYFIWGLNGTKTAANITNRELEYLVAAATNLQEKTLQLYNGWLQTQGNFAKNFINAGQTGSIYTSKKGALEELVEGLVIIADEVANGKIEEPLNGNSGSAKPEAEESRFSNNSKADFANNIRSIQNIYLGDYTTTGKGLTDIVVTKNPTLDTQIKTKITEAINAIENIPGTFTTAISSNRSAVENAQTKVNELHTLLQSQLKPLISNL